MLSEAILSYNMKCFSFHPMADNEVLYDSLHTIVQVSLSGVRAFSDGFFQHLFRLVVHS